MSVRSQLVLQRDVWVKPGNWCVISSAWACHGVWRAAGGLSLGAVNTSVCFSHLELLGVSAGCFLLGELQVFSC